MATASTQSSVLGAGLHRKVSNNSTPEAGIENDRNRSPSRFNSLSTSAANRRGSNGNEEGSLTRNSGWARRTAQAAVSADRERSQLLRTISHLPKTEKAPTGTFSGMEDGPSLPPLTPADFVQPPQYEERHRFRSSGRSLDLTRRSRGFSLSEDSRSPSSSNSTGFGSQGRAKAAQAAAKLRRISMSQLSGSTPITPTSPFTRTAKSAESAEHSTNDARALITGAAAPVSNRILRNNQSTPALQSLGERPPSKKRRATESSQALPNANVEGRIQEEGERVGGSLTSEYGSENDRGAGDSDSVRACPDTRAGSASTHRASSSFQDPRTGK